MRTDPTLLAVAGNARTHVFFQLSAHDLAGPRDRHVGDELHRAWQFIGRQVLATWLEHYGGLGKLPWSRLQQSTWRREGWMHSTPLQFLCRSRCKGGLLPGSP